MEPGGVGGTRAWQGSSGAAEGAGDGGQHAMAESPPGALCAASPPGAKAHRLGRSAEPGSAATVSSKCQRLAESLRKPDVGPGSPQHHSHHGAERHAAPQTSSPGDTS